MNIEELKDFPQSLLIGLLIGLIVGAFIATIDFDRNKTLEDLAWCEEAYIDEVCWHTKSQGDYSYHLECFSTSDFLNAQSENYLTLRDLFTFNHMEVCHDYFKAKGMK